MEFEVKNVIYVGQPVWKEGSTTTMLQYANVVTGPVGCPYEGFTNTDTVTPPTEFLVTQSAKKIMEKVVADATAFSQAKYPNT